MSVPLLFLLERSWLKFGAVVTDWSVVRDETCGGRVGRREAACGDLYFYCSGVRMLETYQN
ncbi:hypothetical protein, partial [Pseudomonas cichorii]|uniref:hypothetical protein n=1 Tax=Pseudomonas cichorii TaxID=36746 RepID=UPI001E3E5B85